MLSRAVVWPIKFYQDRISPKLGHRCRYYPSCSEYATLAINKYGALKGMYKATRRLLRCHPYAEHPYEDYP
ncbi:MAG TPA: membrane protein insertion efficiency factor YidD [Dehalococcoidia bacterium]|nr:membrane protein insertion efficiency factor YidD [Dehalococcoidia bacterium]